MLKFLFALVFLSQKCSGHSKLPSLVYIDRGSQAYGGSLLTLSRVITAVDAVKEIDPAKLKVYAGEISFPLQDQKSRKGKRVAIHPKYKRDESEDKEFIYNIAVIELEQSFTSSDLVSPLNFPKTDSKSAYLNSKNCTVATFSNADKTEPPSKEAHAPIFLEATRVDPDKGYPEKEPVVKYETRLPVLVFKGEKEQCLTDHGSPIFCDGQTFGHLVSHSGCSNSQYHYYHVYWSSQDFLNDPFNKDHKTNASTDSPTSSKKTPSESEDGRPTQYSVFFLVVFAAFTFYYLFISSLSHVPKIYANEEFVSGNSQGNSRGTSQGNT